MKRDLAQDDYIAGRRTRADRHAIRPRLIAREAGAWEEAYIEFFKARLEFRYLLPIRVLQENGTLSGEGFSILAIQCTLIEFLESTAQGVNYRHLPRGAKPRHYEYSVSQDVFTAFLVSREPFAKTFDQAAARDFYVGIRCGLLHEARTKNGWRIWARGDDGSVADTNARIVFRDDFQQGLLAYVESYGKQLQADSQLQAAFVRKFDDLCS